MKSESERLPKDPMAAAASVLGDKWKLLIVQKLSVRPWRFNELQREVGTITAKELTENLRSLEADKLVTRTVIPGPPKKVEYALSKIGESLKPALEAMEKWGEAYKNEIS